MLFLLNSNTTEFQTEHLDQMLTLAGAIVGDPAPSGFCALRTKGFVDPKLLELMPGVVYSKKYGRYYLPENVLPARNGDYAVPKARYAPSGLKLRQYQNEGVTFIDKSVKGCLVADDTGVGKTIQAIHYLHENSFLRPFIVVGPLIALGSWVGEDADAAKYYNLNVAQLKSRSPDPSKLPEADGYFLTYNVLDAWEPWLAAHVRPRAVILDEAHNLRNPRRKDARAAQRLCKDSNIHKRIIMTATPVTNAVRDLWMLLDCAQPDLWGPWVPWAGYHRNSFRTRWCAAHRDEYGWKDEGESNIEELRYRLTRVLLRRSRFHVRKELPAFQRRVVKIPKDGLNQTAFKKYVEVAGAIKTLTAGSGSLGAQTISRLTGMAKHISWAKRDVAVREAMDLVNNAWNKKVVVFCWYQKTAEYISKELIKKGVHVFGPVTGKTTGPRRIKLATQFRDLEDDTGDTGSAFIGTLGATGQALNPLSCASYALCVDLYWVPATLLQAEGRLHREGQKSNVLISYLVVEDSIDMLMYEHLLKKAKAIENCVQDPGALSMCEQLGGRSEEESTAKLLAELSALDFDDMELS